MLRATSPAVGTSSRVHKEQYPWILLQSSYSCEKTASLAQRKLKTKPKLLYLGCEKNQPVACVSVGVFFFFFFLTAPVFRQSCWTAVLPYIPISNSSASLYPSRVLLINTIGGLAIATVERCCFLDNRFVVPAHSRDRSLIIGGVFFSSGVCLCVK